MKAKNIVLLSIILGLCINLLANVVWQYLPDEKVYPYTYVVVTIAIVFVCILLLIFGREDSTDTFLIRLWQKLVLRKTIVFISSTTYEIHEHWFYGELRGKSAMQIHSKWHATNLTDESIQILGAYLVKPRNKVMISVLDSYSNEFSEHIILLPGYPTEIIMDLCIQPPICEEGENFKGKIVFIDQFNKKHKVKATFKPPIQEEN